MSFEIKWLNWALKWKRFPKRHLLRSVIVVVDTALIEALFGIILHRDQV